MRQNATSMQYNTRFTYYPVRADRMFKTRNRTPYITPAVFHARTRKAVSFKPRVNAELSSLSLLLALESAFKRIIVKMRVLASNMVGYVLSGCKLLTQK